LGIADLKAESARVGEAADDCALGAVALRAAQRDDEVECAVRVVAKYRHDFSSSTLDLRVGSPLADAEDYELGGLGRGQADEDDEPAVVEVVLRHGRSVAADEVCVLRLVAQERAVAP